MQSVTIKKVLSECKLHSFVINLKILAERIAPHNLELICVILRIDVTWFFNMISLLLNDLLSNSHRRYAHDRNASFDPSLNTTSNRRPIVFFVLRRLWNIIFCIWNISAKILIHFAFYFIDTELSQLLFFSSCHSFIIKMFDRLDHRLRLIAK